MWWFTFVQFGWFTLSAVRHSYHWSFGNGEISTVKNPSLAFSSAGEYEVFLTVTDNHSGMSSISKKITVIEKDVDPTDPDEEDTKDHNKQD